MGKHVKKSLIHNIALRLFYASYMWGKENVGKLNGIFLRKVFHFIYPEGRGMLSE